MLNTLKMSLKIDFNYAINSFIYNLKKTPILKNIIPNNCQLSLFSFSIKKISVIIFIVRSIWYGKEKKE